MNIPADNCTHHMVLEWHHRRCGYDLLGSKVPHQRLQTSVIVGSVRTYLNGKYHEGSIGVYLQQNPGLGNASIRQNQFPRTYVAHPHKALAQQH